MCNVSKPESDFQQIQRTFAAHIRRPSREPMPEGVSAPRMAIYNRLFFNNLESFLADSFPVMRQLLSHDHWHDMVRDFFASHICVTPFFTRLGEEFLHYLQHERGRFPKDPPYLAELAHYEWVELALTLSDAASLPAVAPPGGDLLQCRLRLSPLAWPLNYAFPVHRIGGDLAPADVDRASVFLLVYRNRDEQVVFLEIDSLTYALLSIMESLGSVIAGELLETLAEMSGCDFNDDFIERGEALLDSMLARGAIGILSATGEVVVGHAVSSATLSRSTRRRRRSSDISGAG